MRIARPGQIAPLGALFVALLGLAAPAGESGSLARQIAELEARIQRLHEEARLTALEAETSEVWMSELALQLPTLDLEIETARQELLLHELELTRNNDALLETLEAERGLVESVEARQRYLLARLRGIYVLGRHPALKLLLHARSPREFLRHAHDFGVLARLDRQHLAELRREQHALERTREQRKRLGAELRALRRTGEQQRVALETRRREKHELLARLEQNHKGFLIQNQELLATGRRLGHTLERLREAAEQDGGEDFAARRGALRWPVEGRILARFGRRRHEKYDAVTVRNGLTLAAQEGLPVRAVFRGRVRYSGRFHGYGKIVLLEHPGAYFTLYGHLGTLEVQEGQEVAEETILGTVGDTGMTAQSRLYFELRSGLEPQDPLDWLAAPSRKVRRPR